MKRALLPILLVAGCASPEPTPLIAAARRAATYARQELPFAPQAIAARSIGKEILVAGRAELAWVAMGEGAETFSAEPQAIAAAAERRGFVITPRALERIEGTALIKTADLEASLAATSAANVWLAGTELARATDSGIDRLRIAGASGNATALAAEDDRRAWVAFGESLYRVSFEEEPKVDEVRGLELGEIGALAIDGNEVLAGGSRGLAIRDSEGRWSRYETEAPVRALAANWALIGDALVARTEVGLIELELEGEHGAPNALGSDVEGRAILARGEGIERYDLIRREDPPLEPGTTPSFSRDVLPWAETGCGCHFRGDSQLADLRTADAWRQRAAILMRRVVMQQPPVMPPPEIEERPTDEQRELLRNWLEGTGED